MSKYRMGNISRQGRVKVVVGLISNDPSLIKGATSALSRKLGEVDLESEVSPFLYTDYYKEEMGTGLMRKFLCFKKTRDPKDLHRLKIATNDLEVSFSHLGRRRINIDPGYITLSKLVLFTTKNYTHRIYLRDGIYGEVTLFYRDGTYRPWEWTYPDYKTKEYIEFFNSARSTLAGKEE